MWRAFTLGAAGLVPGVLLAYLAGRWLEALIAGVSAADIWIFASAAAVVTLAVALGSLTPTRRAVGVDPIHAIRAE